MTKRNAQRADPMYRAIEAALQPGGFISYGAGSSFVSDLEETGSEIEKRIRTDPARATALYETFISGCYEKAEEIDGSSGEFGMFVESLFCGWIRARQAATADHDETARMLLSWMDDDTYGFCHQLERDAVKALDKEGLAAFERQVRSRFDGAPAQDKDRTYARRRGSEILRAIYAEQRNVEKYIELCERTELTPADCETIATVFRAKRKPADALAWVNRGLELEKKHPHGSMAGHNLAGMKRELLAKLGRNADAIEDAWAEFQEDPSTFTYEELMRYVTGAERRAWHGKAMAASERGDLHSLIELWLETKEIERLVARLRKATGAELEDLSHYTTEPAAKRLAKDHADVAAKVYRALGARILKAKKSKYYDAALSNFEEAKRCYQRAGLESQWDALVAEVRKEHQRKLGFMGGFEKLVAGRGPSQEPSFLERARGRWSKRGDS